MIDAPLIRLEELARTYLQERALLKVQRLPLPAELQEIIVAGFVHGATVSQLQGASKLSRSAVRDVARRGGLVSDRRGGYRARR